MQAELYINGSSQIFVYLTGKSRFYRCDDCGEMSEERYELIHVRKQYYIPEDGIYTGCSSKCVVSQFEEGNFKISKENE